MDDIFRLDVLTERKAVAALARSAVAPQLLGILGPRICEIRPLTLEGENVRETCVQAARASIAGEADEARSSARVFRGTGVYGRRLL